MASSVESLQELAASLQKEQERAKAEANEVDKPNYEYNIYKQVDIKKALEKEGINLTKDFNPFNSILGEKFINVCDNTIIAKDEKFNKLFSLKTEINVNTIIGKFASMETFFHYLEHKTKPNDYYIHKLSKLQNRYKRSRGAVKNYWLLVSIPLIVYLAENEEARNYLMETKDKTFIAISKRTADDYEKTDKIFSQFMPTHAIDIKLARYCSILEVLRKMLLQGHFNQEHLQEFIKCNIKVNTTLVDGLD